MIWPFRRPELTVLMVCTANVCRSPAAEALLRHHLKALGKGGSVAVRSAGTEVGAPGRRPDPRVMSILHEMGVKSSGMRAQAASQGLMDEAALVLVMENSHRDVLCERFPEAAERIELLDPSGLDIPDPYFGNKAGVRMTVEQIDGLTRSHAKALLEGLV
ncbi:low molecular weight phosphotyrosine protein phosphatase [Congregibacter variabilis]|uniref:protein-tyrosine-phosphatase n=1 Tax=Congregibacter variabilis TaxID=3081200 RepID=A0ABZ0I6D3_9GAMM|nr:low molecular weight phosphotyrosine protein phosphatase [Congregibacter sp. IMCC43200]